MSSKKIDDWLGSYRTRDGKGSSSPRSLAPDRPGPEGVGSDFEESRDYRMDVETAGRSRMGRGMTVGRSSGGSGSITSPDLSGTTLAGLLSAPGLLNRILVICFFSGPIVGACLASTLPFVFEHYTRGSERVKADLPYESLGGNENYAIMVQMYHGDREDGRDYFERKYSYLTPMFDFWNSDSGRDLYGGISPRDLPIMWPEPRRGFDLKFRELVRAGIGDKRLHVFPFRSEEHLFKVASKCGIGNPNADQQILQWSALRPEDGEAEKTMCREGGWCVVVAETCPHQVFNEF